MNTSRHGIKVEDSLLPTMPFTLTTWWRQTIEPVLPFARHYSCVPDRAACTENKQSPREGPSTQDSNRHRQCNGAGGAVLDDHHLPCLTDEVCIKPRDGETQALHHG